jgi:hypothetical protein
LSSEPHQLALSREWRPTMTLAITVMAPKSRMFWNVRLIPRSTISCGVRPTIESPSKTMSPDVGSSMPVS